MKIYVSKPKVSKKTIDMVVSVLKSGNFVQGVKTKKLENDVAAYTGVKYAVAFNSGTAAIHSALYALGIGKGDEVITTPFTFVATANPIIMLGAKPIFVDINENDFNIDPKLIEKKITKKTKAIVAVDLYGQLANYTEINKIAKKYGLKVVEDACQSIGALYKKRKAGNFGDVGTFSFYATKNIMSGEGGMLTTNNKLIYEKSKMFRHHGQSEKKRYEYVDLGYNYRTTDINAVIASEQLKKIEIFTKRRINNASLLTKGLRDIKGLITPKLRANSRHVFHQYTIRLTKDFISSRKDFLNYLDKCEIGFGIYYPKPLHMHSHFMKQGYKEGDFPVAEKVSKEVLSLPVHHNLTEKEIKYIVNKICEYAKT